MGFQRAHAAAENGMNEIGANILGGMREKSSEGDRLVKCGMIDVVGEVVGRQRTDLEDVY
jgi:hypothetical protein